MQIVTTITFLFLKNVLLEEEKLFLLLFCEETVSLRRVFCLVLFREEAMPILN